MSEPQTFDARWLSMREPHDHAARDPDLVARLARALPHGASVLDLGCGLGSNLRYTAPKLGKPTRWLLADHDQRLLDAIAPSVDPPVVPVRIDLDDPRAPWPDTDAVTAQALLDLVGIPWLDRLVAHLVSGRRPLLAALSVDGRLSFHPSDPQDSRITALFRRHQLTDRGFGPSLGPRTAPWLAGRLHAEGFATYLSEADWQIPGAEADMMRFMVQGIASAASEMAPGDAEIARWEERRLSCTEILTVGHLDLLALPPSMGAGV